MRRFEPVFALLAMLAGCCGYSTRSLLPSHLREVAVVPVENNSLQPGIDLLLEDGLVDEFRRDRSLRVTTLEDADLVVTTSISSYSREPSAYTGEQQVTTYDISIGCSYEAEDRVRNETFHTGTASARVTYDPTGEQEDDAARRAVGELAEQIVRAIVTAW